MSCLGKTETFQVRLPDADMGWRASRVVQLTALIAGVVLVAGSIFLCLAAYQVLPAGVNVISELGISAYGVSFGSLILGVLIITVFGINYFYPNYELHHFLQEIEKDIETSSRTYKTFDNYVKSHPQNFKRKQKRLGELYFKYAQKALEERNPTLALQMFEVACSYGLSLEDQTKGYHAIYGAAYQGGITLSQQQILHYIDVCFSKGEVEQVEKVLTEKQPTAKNFNKIYSNLGNHYASRDSKKALEYYKKAFLMGNDGVLKLILPLLKKGECLAFRDFFIQQAQKRNRRALFEAILILTEMRLDSHSKAFYKLFLGLNVPKFAGRVGTLEYEQRRFKNARNAFEKGRFNLNDSERVALAHCYHKDNNLEKVEEVLKHVKTTPSPFSKVLFEAYSALSDHHHKQHNSHSSYMANALLTTLTGNFDYSVHAKKSKAFLEKANAIRTQSFQKASQLEREKKLEHAAPLFLLAMTPLRGEEVLRQKHLRRGMEGLIRCAEGLEASTLLPLINKALKLRGDITDYVHEVEVEEGWISVTKKWVVKAKDPDFNPLTESKTFRFDVGGKLHLLRAQIWEARGGLSSSQLLEEYKLAANLAPKNPWGARALFALDKEEKPTDSFEGYKQCALKWY